MSEPYRPLFVEPVAIVTVVDPQGCAYRIPAARMTAYLARGFVPITAHQHPRSIDGTPQT